MITLILVCFIILVILLCVVRTTTSLKENVIRYPKIIIQLSIGLALLVSNFGQHWETGNLNTKAQYKAGCGRNVNVSIGINIGIRCLNIIMKENGPSIGCLKYEVVDYEEKFYWQWDPENNLQKQVIRAKHVATPKPILWIVEYFSADGENFKYGRFYQLAGWYCQICLWTAFLTYIGGIIFFQLVVRFGAYCLGICGALQLTASLLWFTIKNPTPLEIYFQSGNITPQFGTTYWLNFFSGIVCLTISIGVIVMEYSCEKTLYKLFKTDPLNNFDEVVYLSKEECKNVYKTSTRDSIPLVNKEDINSDDEPEYYAIYSKRKSIQFPGSKPQPPLRKRIQP